MELIILVNSNRNSVEFRLIVKPFEINSSFNLQYYFIINCFVSSCFKKKKKFNVDAFNLNVACEIR